VGADKAYYYDMQTQQFTPLPLLPGTFTSQAFDVNDAGQIVGKIAIPASDKGFIYFSSISLHLNNDPQVCSKATPAPVGASQFAPFRWSGFAGASASPTC
jgi:uncharacterized membrane protein